MGTVLGITVPASSRDLVSLGTIKEELGVTDNDTDPMLARWITEVSDEVEGFCGRSLVLETVVEEFRVGCIGVPTVGAASAAAPLRLDRYPVVAIDGVVEDGTELTSDQYSLDAAGGFLWRVIAGYRMSWTATQVLVSYSGGYAVPGGVPGRLQRAVQLLIRGRWFARTRDPLLRTVVIPGVIERQFQIASSNTISLNADVVELLESFGDRGL